LRIQFIALSLAADGRKASAAAKYDKMHLALPNERRVFYFYRKRKNEKILKTKIQENEIYILKQAKTIRINSLIRPGFGKTFFLGSYQKLGFLLLAQVLLFFLPKNIIEILVLVEAFLLHF